MTPFFSTFNAASVRGVGRAVGGGAGLYEFTTFTFTNGGQTGTTGPALATLLSSYNTVSNPWLNTTAYFSASSGIQLWTVPTTGNYTIDVYGAAGGTNTYSGNTGGLGARMLGTLSLTQGHKIQILVGQTAGGSNTCGGVGGGGGSFVINQTTSTILAVAGGGGGGGYSYNGIGGTTTTAGTNSNGAPVGTGGTGGSGGTTGGAGCSSPLGGGGGGYSTNGGAPGGFAFVNGAAGGTSTQNGGFGGGGGSNYGGGGGGGYSGGGGGSLAGSCQCNIMGGGGGGGSIHNGTNQTNTSGARSGHGQVIITAV